MHNRHGTIRFELPSILTESLLGLSSRESYVAGFSCALVILG